MYSSVLGYIIKKQQTSWIDSKKNDLQKSA
jgi:hypothetical protein